MSKQRSIAIGGCGVAGLALAALLAREGSRVVVFDKLDAPAPIGSGLILQPVGMHVLDALGAGDALRAKGARIDRLFGIVKPSSQVVLDVRYAALGKPDLSGLAVQRGALFEVLLKAARDAGAELVQRSEVIAHDGAGAFAFADGKSSARFDLCVDALGVRSPLHQSKRRTLAFGALWANVSLRGPFDPHALEQRYERARKMAGVLPTASGAGAHAAFFWSLKGADFESWRAQGLEAWRDDVLKLWPETETLITQLHDPEQLVFARYAHGAMRKPFARRIVHIGDSAHCASPQLGQGANMALLDALALACALERFDDLDQVARAYARMRRWHVWAYQTASFLFTPAYQSDSAAIAWARDWILSPLSRAPLAPQILSSLVAGQWLGPLGAIQRAA